MDHGGNARNRCGNVGIRVGVRGMWDGDQVNQSENLRIGVEMRNKKRGEG